MCMFPNKREKTMSAFHRPFVSGHGERKGYSRISLELCFKYLIINGMPQLEDKEIQCVYTDLISTGQDLISKRTQGLLIEQCLCLTHHAETGFVPAHLSLSMFYYS